MPTYGYRCTACGTTFERFQKISDPPVTACDDCGSPVKKILYPVGIQFKGSGFYVNDSKAAPSGSAVKPAATPAVDSAAPAAAPAPTVAETKPG
jgi:putative FmdB family regulatory protein